MARGITGFTPYPGFKDDTPLYMLQQCLMGCFSWRGKPLRLTDDGNLMYERLGITEQERNVRYFLQLATLAWLTNPFSTQHK